MQRRTSFLSMGVLDIPTSTFESISFGYSFLGDYNLQHECFPRLARQVSSSVLGDSQEYLPIEPWPRTRGNKWFKNNRSLLSNISLRCSKLHLEDLVQASSQFSATANTQATERPFFSSFPCRSRTEHRRTFSFIFFHLFGVHDIVHTRLENNSSDEKISGGITLKGLSLCLCRSRFEQVFFVLQRWISQDHHWNLNLSTRQSSSEDILNLSEVVPRGLPVLRAKPVTPSRCSQRPDVRGCRGLRSRLAVRERQERVLSAALQLPGHPHSAKSLSSSIEIRQNVSTFCQQFMKIVTA